MAEISNSHLRENVVGILKGADLSQLSSKKVRKQLEAKFGMELTDRKKDIDKMVMDYINSQESSQDDADSATSGSEFEEPEDYGPPRKKTKKETDADLAERLQAEENAGGRRTRGGATTKKPAKRKSGGGGGGGSAKKPNKYTEPMVLSTQLAAVMGTDRLKRSDVVKKMWAVIKERNLQDPKNKQFMICDSELLQIFGKKRVKPFGMMKYLKDHMFSAADLEDGAAPSVTANGNNSSDESE